MPHTTMIAPLSPWNPPNVYPTDVGEYQAALVPDEASPTSRRWWNGQSWSNPYNIGWPQRLREQCQRETAIFSPYWKIA